MSRNDYIKRLVLLSALTGLIIIISYVESFIPFFIPGMKIGFANIIILLIIYNFNLLDGILVTIIKVFIVSLLKGNIFTMGFFMSLSGSLLSFFLMFLLYKFVKKIGRVTISILGSVTHTVSQILIALIYLETSAIFYYLPILLLIAIPSGGVIGYLSILINKPLSKISFLQKKEIESQK